MNMPIVKQPVSIKAGNVTRRGMTDLEGYCNIAGRGFKAGQTVTITINGMSSYIMLNAGINKLQANMPMP